MMKRRRPARFRDGLVVPWRVNVGIRETPAWATRFAPMTHDVLDTPLEVALVEGEVVITGPNGLGGSMTLRAARESAERLRRIVDQVDGGETYQKPLG